MAKMVEKQGDESGYLVNWAEYTMLVRATSPYTAARSAFSEAYKQDGLLVKISKDIVVAALSDLEEEILPRSIHSLNLMPALTERKASFLQNIKSAEKIAGIEVLNDLGLYSLADQASILFESI
jgi:hypothetical protein